MKAAVFEGLERITVKEVPDPVLPDDGLIIKVHACAVCGSDLRILRHGNPRVVPPQILGHEIAGEVVAVGSRVNGFTVGDRIAVGADVPCGLCKYCRTGRGNNCAINYAIGYQFPGGFAEYMVLNNLTISFGPVHHIPERLVYDEAALAEPLACCINGLEMSDIQLGDTVIVIGAGPVGCMLMSLARRFGAGRVFAVQRSKNRLEYARRLGGADEVICSLEEDPVSAVRRATAGEGGDVVITANAAHQSHTQALQMVGANGRVNFFGGLPKEAPPIEVQSNLIHYKEITITGSHGSVPRQHELALRLLAWGAIKGSDYVTHAFSLDEMQQALAVADRHQGMKVVIHPHRS